MKILALIPARGGSKGIPKKNIKILGDRPLINYTIETALKCKAIDQVIVSTDDVAIADISLIAGATIPFLRPATLAKDDSPTLDTIIHALQYFDKKNIHFDAVCLLQPTTPFRAVVDLEKAIQKFKENELDSLISVRKVPHTYNPHWVFEPIKDSNFLKIATGEKKIITRRQALPPAYYRDGAIYLIKKDVIQKQYSLYGEKIGYYTMNNSAEINIDTMEDWQKAVQYLTSSKSKESE